jgi:hypothetical protein
MWDFFYKQVKVWWTDCRICYKDTDAYVLAINTPDVYCDILSDSEWFDTSDYPHSHKLYSLKNKKSVGLFKDEINSIPMTHFVSLRPKMYAFKCATGRVSKKCKGVKKNYVKNTLEFEDFVSCLDLDKKIFAQFNTFRSYKHFVYSIRQSKFKCS